MNKAWLDDTADKMLSVLQRYDIGNALHEHCLKNLQQWVENKKDLMRLLSKHPQWSEQDLAIVMQQGRTRQMDVDAAMILLYSFTPSAVTCETEPYRHMDIEWANVIHYAKSPLLTEEQVEILRSIDAQASVGQKISRAFNAWCSKVGYNKYKGFNKTFAKFADALNPINITETMFLSVHPIDFLMMSSGNSWKTCQSLDGCYSGGTLSLMNDAPTMVCYTVNNGDGKLPPHHREKTMRQLFHYADRTLVQGRLYPKTYHCKQEAEYAMFRAAVQAMIAECEGVPNLWHTTHSHDDLETYAKTNRVASHYADYDFNKEECCLSRLGSEYNEITIGARNYCVVCGGHCDGSEIACSDCSDEKCHHCGLHDHPDEMTQLSDGHWYCMHCTSVCEQCDEGTVTDDLTVVFTSSNGETAETQRVCEDCLCDYFYCEDCGDYYPRYDSKHERSSGHLLPILHKYDDLRVCLACYLETGGVLTDEQQAAFARETHALECA